MISMDIIGLMLASWCLVVTTATTPPPPPTTTARGASLNMIMSRINLIKSPITKPQSLDTMKQQKDHLSTSTVTSNTSNVALHHPVIVAVVDRWRSQSKIGNRGVHDQMKIALCIEGGGMRGCVAAGSAAAISFLGLNDAVDVVYGSSVGSMIGCYFVSRQYSGHRIYHGIIAQCR